MTIEKNRCSIGLLASQLWDVAIGKHPTSAAGFKLPTTGPWQKFKSWARSLLTPTLSPNQPLAFLAFLSEKKVHLRFEYYRSAYTQLVRVRSGAEAAAWQLSVCKS